MQDDEPLARACVEAMSAGDVETLSRLLAEHPGLATTRICRDRPSDRGVVAERTLLHIVTDWPGHLPNGRAMVGALVGAGADVNAGLVGPHHETPLHWAASCDDVEVLDALLDHGADIEAPGAVIAGGTPLADAVAFGHWNAARRLVARGARTTLWQAAALGLMDRVVEDLASRQTTRDEVTQAFWLACHGGQRQAAEYLLGRGADINWVGYDALTPIDAARRSGADALVEWLLGRGARSAG
jgi:uncharacterized protein